MSNLLILVKILTAIYQVKRINDKTLLNELLDLLQTVPISSSEVFIQDKKTEEDIRATIDWILEQPDDEPIIKSMLMQRVMDFTANAPELKTSIELGLEDVASEERIRQIIYKHIKEIRRNATDSSFSKNFKKTIKEFHFGDVKKFKKEDWIKLSDLIQEKINDNFNEDKQTEVVGTVTSDDPKSFESVISQAKSEASLDGILKLGMQGLNKALEPDGGLRRAKFYLFNALTNRGKSFTLGHVLASVGLYNKPLLRDKSKIPTVVLDSAEDSLDLIIVRMFKLFCVAETGELKDFMTCTAEEIINTIVNGFKKNGWCLIINQIEPNKDNFYKFCDRIRKLELKGHEVILLAYDYLAMMELEGMTGDTKGDKLQMLYRKVRSFTMARGICFVTPHQLSPEAKKILRESDDESEVYFGREVAGKSMTETSTKLTNEVDVEITIHVAKTDLKNYWTFSIGKQRGEGCDPKDRFGIYDLDPEKGLVHDINGKPAYRKSLKHRLDENGNSIPDWDDFSREAA
ncbi:putative DNA helicase [Erwinia phage vB_EamM_RisingSun]|uniref:Putative DNA helicase n=2 Tax=Risingsunvirus risingsun TaxID=2560435 RepID=A0A223LJA6_9CAUD|nr:DnaB-like replicative helicase [Erwinia phage vB_EamM_RisingSun]ASU03589.1 putative DNA helicase [Erwinia phage vB_EamM_RisingSun]ASU03834.1 putative DNA helicase [Erwinia phage vB_EamM_Joad]